ncbi:triosephosphate isomerase [Algibacter lectus]|uniref:Triosephosphate isomerase n=1 Tax=Algibacter lectus TaxID=221126 RepID=A0A090WT90_9FLAO|nr:triosephosphate isomerase [Algibacter lectus]
MRKNIVAGNWKMNNDLAQTEALITALKNQTTSSNAEVMVAPTFTNLFQAYQALKTSNIEVIAQNMHFAENGAYTGEISASMLKSIGVNTVILGHSERREYFNETDELLAKKTDAALAKGIRVIFCFGEELADRKSGNEETIVGNQIKNALFHLEAAAFQNIVLAYELFGPLVQAKLQAQSKLKICMHLLEKHLPINTETMLPMRFQSFTEVVLSQQMLKKFFLNQT